MTNRTKRKLPDHVINHYGSSRAFRAAKRKQAKDVLRAVNELRAGCAFFPTTYPKQWKELNSAINAIVADLSVKNWGR